MEARRDGGPDFASPQADGRTSKQKKRWPKGKNKK
jgi:hypothetical protein